MTRIRVAAPSTPAWQYDVVLEPGALERLPEITAAVVPSRRCAVISDAVVADLYGEKVRAGFEAAGWAVDLLRFPAGEQAKNRDSWGSVIDSVAGRGLGRDSCIIALGGGVTGDLGGFVAATYLRGVALVQVPTTLLSMLDAAVGGKTGLDTPAGKNLIGAFHHPAAVVIDPATLGTLPTDHFRAGLAEAVKHGAIADEAYLAWIASRADALADHDAEALEHLIRRSVEIKAEVVSADPNERGRRQILNFGHTFGHAYETWTGYRTLHGFAVGLGMVAAAALGERAGVTEAGTASRLREVLTALHVPPRPNGPVPAERIVDLARADKKARDGRIRYTLLRRAGAVAEAPGGGWTHALDDSLAIEVLRDLWE